jgi:hypothetical protein
MTTGIRFSVSLCIAFVLWLNGPPSILGIDNMALDRMSPRRSLQSHRKQAHAELNWAPSEIMVEVSLALIKGSYGEGVASRRNTSLDVRHVIVERASDMDDATESLARWRHNVFLMLQFIQNDA